LVTTTGRVSEESRDLTARGAADPLTGGGVIADISTGAAAAVTAVEVVVPAVTVEAWLAGV